MWHGNGRFLKRSVSLSNIKHEKPRSFFISNEYINRVLIFVVVVRYAYACEYNADECNVAIDYSIKKKYLSKEKYDNLLQVRFKSIFVFFYILNLIESKKEKREEKKTDSFIDQIFFGTIYK